MKCEKQPMPNIVVWSWMREVLQLSGIELLLFAFLFERTFDGMHKCFEKLTDFENWFGSTRQAIIRHIDKMVDKNILFKNCEPDKKNPMIKHNNYSINVEHVTQLCEQSPFDIYQNFLESYRILLCQKFPLEQGRINSYIENLEQWYYNKNIEIVVTFNQLAQLMRDNNSENYTLDSLLQSFQTISDKRSYEHKTKTSKNKTNTGALLEKPKRKSKQALKNEWDKEKRSMNQDFVMYKAKNSEELLQILNDFLNTDNGRSYTPAQWGQQLDYLFKHARTVERMIEGVKISYMNNYRSIYIADKYEVDIDAKLAEIESYVRDEGEDSEELRQYLVDYVLETPKGKSYTIKQFKMALKTLSKYCTTLKDKIRSVETSYANSYAALAYPPSSNNSSQSDIEVDMKEKEILVSEFITKGYYQLVPELRDLLLQYIKTVPAGKSMTKELFALNLDNLRLFCFLDDSKIQKVKMAILNNYSKFATEDFEESKRLKSRFETRESHADDLDRNRKQNVLDAKRKNPNNPLLKDIELPKKERTVV